MTQDDLIAQCKLGNPAAYTVLYNQHSRAVYNAILRLVAHTGEAEDILQETFVAAFGQIKDLKYTSGFGGWVKQIGINKSIDAIRKRKLKLVEFEPELIYEEEEEKIDEAEFEFNMEAVTDAIGSLQGSYRTVFNLYAIENISHAEIGRLLGMENNTVRTQYHRAKQKILNTLKENRRVS
jgi:RNA polymerase sigma factor (sigma-70 family)